MGGEPHGDIVELRDGSAVRIRPVEPDDKQSFREGMQRLSEESRRTRFFAPIRRLTAQQLHFFTEVDHRDHEAIGAETVDGEPVGVARYVRAGEGSEVAEVAVVVLDDWQGRGVAGALLDRLVARARENGITRFCAVVQPTNRRIVDTLSRVGPLSVTRRERDATILRIELPAAGGRLTVLREALRAAARGDLLPAVLGGREQDDRAQ